MQYSAHGEDYPQAPRLEPARPLYRSTGDRTDPEASATGEEPDGSTKRTAWGDERRKDTEETAKCCTSESDCEEGGEGTLGIA